MGQTIYEIDEYGNETHYFYYNDTGRLMAVLDPTGQALYYTYDEIGQLTNVVPASGTRTDTPPSKHSNEEEVKYTYDAYDRLSTIVTKTTTYTFAYNSYDAVRSVSIGSTAVVSYTYNDHNGKLNTLTYANGYTEDYVYDDLDRLTELWYTQGSGTRTLAYSYEYTADGGLASFTDHRTDQQTVYQYDISGQLTRVATLEDGAYVLKTDYIYDDLSQLSRRTYTMSYVAASYWNGSVTDTLSLRETYTYDTEGRLTGIATNGSVFCVNTQYQYDAFGRPTQSTVTTSNNGYTSSVYYTYQTTNGQTGSLISEYRSQVGGVDVNDYRYTYDKNGNITRIRNSYAETVYYTYDNLGQLIEEQNNNFNKLFTYTYDNAGNITSVTTKDLSTGSSYTETYSYYSATTGWGDRLAYIQLNEYDTMSFSYDALGNISHYTSTYPSEDVYLTWKGRQLVSFRPDYMCGYDYYFSYDDEGRRISKGTEGWIYTNYTYEGDLLVAEIQNWYTLIFLYDGMGQPIGMLYKYTGSTTTSEWQLFWYEKNLQGDVVAVYDNNGVKQVSYVYDAWGNTTITTHVSGTAASKNPIRYRSYYYDSDIGLYYLGTRWYSPRFHRFLSPDNVDVTAATPGGLTDKNLYAYCDNNPVMRVDYTGEFWNIVIGGAIGAVVGGILGGFTARKNGQDILTGILTGAGLGAVAGGIIGSGSVSLISGGLSSVAGKATTDIFGAMAYGSSFGSWEDYAVAFVFGSIGSLAGNVSSLSKNIIDVFARPAANQLAKIGTRGGTFDTNKYMFDVVTRGLTSKGSQNVIRGNIGDINLSVDLSKCFARATARAVYSAFQ